MKSFLWSVFTGDTYEGVKRPHLLSDIDVNILLTYAYEVLRNPQLHFEDYVGNEEDINDYLETLVYALIKNEPDMSMPIGSIVMMGSGFLPDGWLYCDGNEVLKTSYPDLWDRITNTWGTPTLGSDYFVLPDFRNRSPYGYQSGGGASKNLGSYHGAETHTLTETQMPAHKHLSYDVNQYTQVAAGVSGTYGLVGGITGSAETGSKGGDSPHNNLHPVAVCGFIIYAGV